MFPLKDTIPSSRKPIMTFSLITANIAVFIYQLILSRQAVVVGREMWNAMDVFVYQFAMIPARFTDGEFSSSVIQTLGWAPFPLLTVGTSVFMHGSWMHILSNMWALWIFGDNVEDEMGPWKFLIFYLLCGIAANIVQFASSPFSQIPVLGASGSIAGIMGAYMVLFPRSRIITLLILFIFPYFLAIPAPLYLGFWFALQFLGGATTVLARGMQGGVAYWAHIGGFLFGLLSFQGFIRRIRYYS